MLFYTFYACTFIYKSLKPRGIRIFVEIFFKNKDIKKEFKQLIIILISFTILYDV